MSTAVAPEDCPPLLLTEGGPGDLVLRRLGLKPLGVSSRRTAVALAAITWIPLLVLSLVDGVAAAGRQIPFLSDLAAHVRFLVALPVLILAEIPIGLRLRSAAAHFVTAGLITDDDRPRFVRFILGAQRLRDSRIAEIVILVASYVAAYEFLVRAGFQGGDTWYTAGPDGRHTLAGYWYALVAVPIFQFVLYRWVYRMLVWAWFLRKLTTLDLRLAPTHPDGAAGLGFLGKACIPFGVLLFAMSAVVASAIATRVLFTGAPLDDFQVSYAALFVIALALFVGPILVFVPVLLGVKQRGLLSYGTLASRYTQAFERKWIVPDRTPDEPLLGTADIQSLADLGNSFGLVRSMRALPIQTADFVAMAIPGVIPAIPLAATVMPVGDIVKGLLKLIV
jgi:hypothetical protein